MIFITQQHILSESINEVDFSLYDAFGADDFESGTLIKLGQGLGGEPVLINSVLAVLEKLKLAGCNYVGLDYHGDHHGYDFSGYHVRLAEQKEIAEYEREQDAELAREQEISALYRQIEALRAAPL